MRTPDNIKNVVTEGIKKGLDDTKAGRGQELTDGYISDLKSKALSRIIAKSYYSGKHQFENGQKMSFDEFKTKFIREHSLKGKI